MSVDKTEPSSKTDTTPSPSIDAAPHDPTEGRYSRRKFLQLLWKLPLKLAFLGVAAKSLRASEAPQRRNYSTLPEAVYIYDGTNSSEKAVTTIAPIYENNQMNEHVRVIDSTVQQPFLPNDVPDSDAEFPALVLYCPEFQDPIPDSENQKSAKEQVTNLIKKAKDIAGADRVVMIFTRSQDLKPGIKSPNITVDTDVSLKAFFPMNDTKIEEVTTFFTEYFPQFSIGEELLAAISRQEVFCYWRNFGSQQGHGMFPDIYLVTEK